MLETDVVLYVAAKKGQFLASSIRFIIIAILLAISIHIYLEWSIDRQQAKNQFLQNQVMHGQIVLNELKKQKETQLAISSELSLILNLRAKSFQSVRFLNELTKVIPIDVSLTKAAHEGNVITLEGEAANDHSLQELMQNLTNSNVFTQPMLKGISAEQNGVNNERYFQLQMTQQG